jgi:hypothetical protein
LRQWAQWKERIRAAWGLVQKDLRICGQHLNMMQQRLMQVEGEMQGEEVVLFLNIVMQQRLAEVEGEMRGERSF